MRNIWLWSDPHFNHANIIKYCDRPFASVAEMNEALISNWNEKVKPNDIGYMLGDIYMGGKSTVNGILHRLNGHKRLILGNHDDLNDGLLTEHFEKILMWRQFKEFGVTFSHVPLHEGSLTEKFPRNVHGHIHEKQIADPRYVCVCVEHTGYAPIHIEDIKHFMSLRVHDGKTKSEPTNQNQEKTATPVP